MPSVTIVMTVYEREELALRAAYSVLQQTHADWELRVYMDGQYPILAETLREYALQRGVGDRLSIVMQQQPRGTYGNPLRRAGLLAASGDYVLFLGHDCLLDKDCLATHLAAVRAETPWALSCTRIDHWTKREFGSPESPLQLERPVGIVPGLTFSVTELSIGAVDLTCVLFPTAVARMCGVFRESWDQVYVADLLSIAACCARVPLVYTPVITGVHF